MLQRLTYFSRGTIELDLEKLVAGSAAANAATGITGVLLAERDIFVQVLEGPRERVSALFVRIANDTRHTGVTLVESLQIAEACYPDWGMGLLCNATKTTSLWPAYGERLFEPAEMSTRAINDFIRLAAFELMSQRPPQTSRAR